MPQLPPQEMRPEDADRLTAAADLFRRCGARQVQFRFDPGPDEDGPVVYNTVAVFHGKRFECAAAANPFRSADRLVVQLVDGGLCARCGRATAALTETDPATAKRLGKSGICVIERTGGHYYSGCGGHELAELSRLA